MRSVPLSEFQDRLSALVEESPVASSIDSARRPIGPPKAKISRSAYLRRDDSACGLSLPVHHSPTRSGIAAITPAPSRSVSAGHPLHPLTPESMDLTPITCVGWFHLHFADWGEVFRVGSSRPAWRVLRPVLLAAAAATSWLAISASAATADSSSGQEPLLGDVRSTVSALTSPASGKPAPALISIQPVTSPAQSTQSEAVDLASTLPELQPISHAITTRADNLLGNVPAVSTVAPLPSLTPRTDSVVEVADSAVSAAAGTADSTVSTVVETVSPILSPVIEPVTGAKPVPVQPLAPGGAVPPALPGDPGTGTPGGSPALQAGEDHSTGATSETSATAAATAPLAPSAVNGNEATASVPCSQLPPQAQTVMAMAAVPEDPSGDLGEALPDALPGLPGSGSAASASPGGNPQPAWLSHYHLDLAGSLSVPAQGTLLEVPSPVSFDPGSSPD